MLVLRTSNFQVATIRPIVPRHKHCLYCSSLNFLPRASLKIKLNDDYGKFYLQKNVLVSETFSRTSTLHPGIFFGREPWADSVSPPMNTIASRDQFKPIRIAENLVANYNGGIK